MQRSRGWMGLALLLAGCASAAPPDGPRGGGADPDGGVAGGPGVGDLAGATDLATGLPFAPDLAEPPSPLGTGGTWTAMPGPADALTGPLDSLYPSIALWGGAPAIAWVEGADTRVATFAGGWTALGGALNASAGGRTTTPQLAARGGQLAVAFLEPSGSAGVNAAHVYGWSSGAWSAIGAAVPFQLSFLGDLSLALDGAGHPAIAWTQQVGGASSGPSNVYVQRFDGTSWSAYGGGFAAESATSSALAAQLRIDAADHLYVTWQETFVHVYTDVGTWSAVGPSGGKLAAGAATSSFEQQLALDGQGRPLVAWMEYDGTASSIYVARFDAGAWQVLTAAPLSATPGATNAQLADLTVDGSDVPIVSWTENDVGGAETAWVARVGGGAPSFVGQPLHLPAGLRYLGPPQLVVDAAGTATLVYTGQQISDGKSRLFVWRYVSP